jgi:hypothetical protein
VLVELEVLEVLEVLALEVQSQQLHLLRELDPLLLEAASAQQDNPPLQAPELKLPLPALVLVLGLAVVLVPALVLAALLVVTFKPSLA